jgi:subtilisin family serine protease
MLKKLGFSLLLILALSLSSIDSVFADFGVEPVLPLAAAPSAETGEMVDETPALWFVQLGSVPTVEGTSLTTIMNERAIFRTHATRAGLKYEERYAFSTLFNGFSIAIAPSQLGVLARLPGVKAIYPVEAVTMPETTEGINPDLYTALAMTGADIAQSELGLTGKGVKVAVMDTGIDYDHPDLGGCFGPGCRVEYGYDFVGDDFDYYKTPVPDPDPDDCGGHGTHVAGIVGANGVVKGVAPEVTFGAYRVFGCVGSTTADIMILAMEAALADGMDVLNMSIGSAYQWPQYPTAMAADRLVGQGVVVVASIGNSGANGLYSAGAPGLGKYVIGVASFDNTNVYLPYFTVNGQNVGYVTMSFSAPAPTSGTGEIVDVGLACSALPAGAADGKVALAARGTCSFATKAINAINAGAVAVLVSNNVPGVFNGTLGAPLGSDVPVVGISQADGAFIRAQAAPIMMEWTDQKASFPSPTGGLISSFSSYGLAPDLSVKPDIGAPGGNIYSTYPLELGGYATLGGTSMSSPHVAGAAALFLQAHPDTPAALVRNYLQNSADPQDWWGYPGVGYIDNVHRQGAGMLDIDDAILATAKVEPSKIAAGESEAGPFTSVLKVYNKGLDEVTYDLSYYNALSTGSNTFAPSFWLSDASVTFDADTITIPKGGVAFVTVTINPATGPTGGQYGGYITFTPTDGGQVMSVPFAGFIGDYQAKQVLVPTVYGFPWVAISIGGLFYGPVTGPDDWTFTMVGEDVPNFLLHFDHHPRVMSVKIYSEKGKYWQNAYYEQYLPRNSTSTGIYAFPFDGTTFMNNKFYTVPDGNYYAVISILKANGDASNPAHWETWTSPVFKIDRP